MPRNHKGIIQSLYCGLYGLVDPTYSGLFNPALLNFGSIVTTAKNPKNSFL